MKYFIVSLNLLLSSVSLRPVVGPWPPRSPSSNLLSSLLPPSSSVSGATLELSLQTASFHLRLGFSTDLLPAKHSLLFVESSVFSTGPAHCNLFRRKNVGMPHDHTVCRSLHYCTLPWLAWLRILSWGFSFHEG